MEIRLNLIDVEGYWMHGETDYFNGDFAGSYKVYSRGLEMSWEVGFDLHTVAVI
jgi:hypothetical protein